MRIAIVGSGGVGGYFGGRLAAAGTDVTFIARGAHLAALRSRGLRINSPLGNLHLPRVNATDDPAQAGAADIVFFTVKLYDTDAAIGSLPALLGPHTIVVPFQNGVDSASVLGRAVGRTHVAGGTTYVSAHIQEPGVIHHTAMNRLVFGPLESAQMKGLEALREATMAAGIETTLSDRVMVEVWTKFVRLTAFSGMTAVTRCPLGPVMTDPDLSALLKAALRESIAVARGRQIPLAAKVFDEIVSSLAATPGMKSSMLVDLEGGRRLELPWLSGAVVRIGEEVGVETPTHRLIEALLRPHVNGRNPDA